MISMPNPDSEAIKRIFIGILIALIATSSDLFSKKVIFDLLLSVASQEQTTNPQIKIFDFFSIVYVKNQGVSFGMFSGFENSNLVFSLLQGFIGIAVFIYMLLSKSMIMTIGLALIFGGAMGNVIDRIMRGGVMDFLDFHIANYHWPAFNLADSFVFLGVCVMIYLEFFAKRSVKNQETTKKVK